MSKINLKKNNPTNFDNTKLNSNNNKPKKPS